jgi:hypothetical protein
MAAPADSGEMAIHVADTRDANYEPQIVVAGANGRLSEIAFVFSAALVDGPAMAGIFVDKP